MTKIRSGALSWLMSHRGLRIDCVNFYLVVPPIFPLSALPGFHLPKCHLRHNNNKKASHFESISVGSWVLSRSSLAATPGMRPLPAGSNSAKAAFHSAKSALLATIHPPERRSGSHSNSSSRVSETVGNNLGDCHIRMNNVQLALFNGPRLNRPLNLKGVLSRVPNMNPSESFRFSSDDEEEALNCCLLVSRARKSWRVSIFFQMSFTDISAIHSTNRGIIQIQRNHPLSMYFPEFHWTWTLYRTLISNQCATLS